MSKDVLKTALKLVEKNKNAMVASVDDDGYPFSKGHSIYEKS